MATKPLFVIFCLIALSIAVMAETQITLNQWTATQSVAGKEFGEMLYFTIPPEQPTPEQPTREIVIKMKAVSSASGFDPDLYVRFGSAPERTTYDASDISLSDEHVVTITRSERFPMTAGTKVYIGVYAYSTTPGSYQVYANVHGCSHSNCGGETRGICHPTEGTCQCKPGFTVLPNCNAQELVQQLDVPHTNTLLHNQIIYYKVTLPTVQKKGWFRANVSRTSTESNGAAILVMKKGGYPTANDNVAMQWVYNTHSSAALVLDDNKYSPGEWFVGVINNAKSSFGYQISLHVEHCKNSCSRHGTCNIETSQCTCDPGYTISPEDCSIRSEELNFGRPQVLNPEPWGQTFFSIPISQELADAPLEVGVNLELQGDVAGTTNWPVLYATTSDSKPTTLSYDFTSPRPASHNTTLFIPDSHVVPGKINLLIQNQNARDVQYNVQVFARPHCPTGCIKHGICTLTAQCNCFQGFVGGSCDLSQEDCNKIRKITVGISYGAAIAIFVLAAAAAAGIAAFIYAKFFYVAPQQSAQPDLVYDPLAI